MKQAYVYILANKRNGTLYIGVTSNLEKRIWEHKQGQISGFTKKYNVKHLVFCEVFPSIDQAIAQEKALKKWHRKWKLDLIETSNPKWLDLMSGKPIPS